MTRLSELTGNPTLNRVVLLCKSQTILRINRTVLLQLRHGVGGFTDVKRVEEVTPGQLLVYRVSDKQVGNGMFQRVREVAGEIVLELLPTELPGFRYGDPTPTGWFSPTRMPFSRPDTAATRWPAPSRPPSPSSDYQ